MPPVPPPPGVLYYGNTAGGGVKSADFVTELATKADLDKFVQSQVRPAQQWN